MVVFLLLLFVVGIAIAYYYDLKQFIKSNADKGQKKMYMAMIIGIVAMLVSMSLLDYNLYEMVVGGIIFMILFFVFTVLTNLFRK